MLSDEHAGELDAQLRLVKTWIRKAGEALCTFFIADTGAFLRNSSTVKNDTELHPTSTARSIVALCDYLRFISEEEARPSAQFNAARTYLSITTKKFLSSLMTPKGKKARTSRTNDQNLFTDGYLLLAIASSLAARDGLNLQMDSDGLKTVARAIARENVSQIRRQKGGAFEDGGAVHDFITLAAVRGVDAIYGIDGQEVKWRDDFQVRVREDLLKQLAYHAAGISSRFDPAELAFTTGVLNRFQLQDSQQLSDSAIKAIITTQANDGAWPTARLVEYEGKRPMLHVASYEVALVLVQLLSRQFARRQFGSCDLILVSLAKAFGLVRAYFEQGDSYSGWTNDHARRTGVIESWATAMVLTFLVQYHDVLQTLQQGRVLAKYEVAYPERSDTFWPWPDLTASLRGSRRGSLLISESMSDPTADGCLTTALNQFVIEPIQRNWIRRPQTSGSAILLYGDPGTRKTSLAKQVAATLEWPFLTLSPPDFLKRGGLEGFEVSAAEIFDDLFRLRRAVVLLDECEDFFKKREEKQNLESRTIGAFITAGMLPRLQSLHQKYWVITILATNSALETLDDAVVRPGRFDFLQPLLQPELEAQVRYIKRVLKENTAACATAEKVLRNYSLRVAKGSRHGIISFAVLDQFADRLRETRLTGIKAAARTLEQLLARRPSLIEKLEWD